MITPDNAQKPTKLRLSRNDRILINGTPYRCIETNDRGHVLRRVDNDLEESFRHRDMAALFRSGKVEIARRYFTTEAVRARLNDAPKHLADLSPKDAAMVLWRKEYVERFLRLEGDKSKRVKRSDRSMLEVIPQIQMEMIADRVASPTGERQPAKLRAGQTEPPLAKPPTPRTLRKWLRIFETCDCDPRALCNCYNRSGNTNRRLLPIIVALMNKYAQQYCDESKSTKEDCYRQLKSEVGEWNDANATKLPLPSKKAFFRVIDGIDKFEVETARKGIEAAKKKFFVCHEGLPVIRPLERVEIDEWSAQLITLVADPDILALLSDEERSKIERVRVHFCVAIDCATRCIVGMSMARTASSQNALNTVRMICTDKSDLAAAAGARSTWHFHGRPDLIATDNGTSFTAWEFRTIVADLRSALEFTPAGKPQYRGRIERLFATINMQVLSAFTGRTFSNVVQRGDYPAEERALAHRRGTCGRYGPVCGRPISQPATRRSRWRNASQRVEAAD